MPSVAVSSKQERASSSATCAAVAALNCLSQTWAFSPNSTTTTGSADRSWRHSTSAPSSLAWMRATSTAAGRGWRRSCSMVCSSPPPRVSSRASTGTCSTQGTRLGCRASSRWSAERTTSSSSWGWVISRTMAAWSCSRKNEVGPRSASTTEGHAWGPSGSAFSIVLTVVHGYVALCRSSRSGAHHEHGRRPSSARCSSAATCSPCTNRSAT